MYRFGRQPTLVLMSVTLCLLFLAGASVLAQDEVTTENRAKELYNEGVKAMQEGKPQEAIMAYKGVVEMMPEYVDAHLNLGVIYFQQKQYDLALEEFMQVTQLDPQSAEGFANVGRVRYATNDGLAEDAFKTAISLDPNDAGLKLELAKAIYSKGKSRAADAAAALQAAHAAGAQDELSLYMLGKSYYNMGQKDKAVEQYKQSIAVKDNYNSRSALGSIYLQQEKFKQAATEFKQAMKLAPSRYYASYNYAIAVESSDPENYDVNIANWEAFVKTAKSNPSAKDRVTEAREHITALKESKKVADMNN